MYDVIFSRLLRFCTVFAILALCASGATPSRQAADLAAQAEAANTANRPAEALELADNALRLDSADVKALFERGRALRKLQRLDEATAHFQAALKRFPQNLYLHFGAATVYDDAKQPAKALVHYETLARLDPNDPDWLAAIGVTCFELGQPDRAITELKKALARDPKSVAAQGNLAFILLRLGRAEESAAAYTALLRLQPDNQQAQMRLAEARQLQKKGANAAELSQLAGSANGKERFAEALAQAEGALRIDPGHEGALVEKGRALRGLGRMDDALAHFEKALARFPKSARLHNYYGGTLGQAGKHDRAIAEQKIAAQLDPQNISYLSNQVSHYIALKDYAGAEAVCRAALALDQKSASAHGNLGAVFLLTNRLDEGIAEFEESLRLNPNNPKAQAAIDAARNQQRVMAEAGIPAAKAKQSPPATVAQKTAPARTGTTQTPAAAAKSPTQSQPARQVAASTSETPKTKPTPQDTAAPSKVSSAPATAKASPPVTEKSAPKKSVAKAVVPAEKKPAPQPQPQSTPQPAPAASPTKLEPLPEPPAPPTGYYKLVKVEMPLKSIPSKIPGEGYEVVYGPKSGTSSFTAYITNKVYTGELNNIKEAGSETVTISTQWSFPDKLIPGVPILFRISGGDSSRYHEYYGSLGINAGGISQFMGGFRITQSTGRTNAPIPSNSSDSFEVVLPESINRWWLALEAERNKTPAPMTTLRLRDKSISDIVMLGRPDGEWASGDDPRTPDQVPMVDLKVPLLNWVNDSGDADPCPRDIVINVGKPYEDVAFYTYRWEGPPAPIAGINDRGPVNIKIETANRKELRADGRDGLWIAARVVEDYNSHVSAGLATKLTQALEFAGAGADREWLDLGQTKTSGGWKLIYVRASNPNPSGGTSTTPPESVSITASVKEGDKRFAKTLRLAIAPDAKLDAQPDLIELSAMSGQTAQVKVAIENPGTERWEFRTEYDKTDRPLAKAEIKRVDAKSALLNLKEASLEPRRTGGSDERATLKIFAEQKGREPLERHIRLVVAQEGLFVDAQGRDPQTRQFRLEADGKGVPLEIDFRIFAQDPKTKRILNVTRDPGGFKDVKIECLEPKNSPAGRMLESAKLKMELAGIRSSNTPAGILRITLDKELPSDGRVVPCDFRISYGGGKDAAFSAIVTVSVATTQNGPGGKEWKLELERCQTVIDKFVPAAYSAKIQAMLDRRKMTLGADGLALLRKKIWAAAEQLTLGEGGQGYADEARWAGRITECLEWSEWAGDMAFGAVIGNFVGPYGAMATTTLKGVVISAINAYQDGQSADAWLWENLLTIPGLLEGKAIDPDQFQRWGMQSKAKAWTLYVGYHFLKNLWNGQSVIEALQNTGKTVGNDVLAIWLNGEVQRHGNRSVSGWAGDKAKAAVDNVKAASQNVAQGIAIAQKAMTPENPLDKPRVASPNEPEPEAITRIRRGAGQGPDDRMYASTNDVIAVMKDPSMVRAIKKAPPEIQEAFNNTRELLYWQHDVEVVQHVKDTVPGMQGRTVRVLEFRTPGDTSNSINTDRDYRVCYYGGKHPKTGKDQWIEVPREKWEGKSYESFARVTGGPSDDPKAAREWAEQHQQLATDKGHAEASADFSDQKRIFNKKTRQYETIQIASNFERMTKGGEGLELADPQSLGRMYQLKVADARFPHEAFVQANKGVGALRALRENYDNQGRNIGQLPARMSNGMEIVEKVVARLKADPNCRDPEAIAEGEKQLRAQGFSNLEDFMNKLGSQMESFKFMQ